jgi:uncharacterized protein (UPF0248 family)
MVSRPVLVGRRMIPLHELLNRIRWDPEFGRSNFKLGYYDRVEDGIILVSFEEVSFPAEAPNTFQLIDAEGRIHRVPFHRVREVYQDARRVWHRPPEAKQGG